MGMFDYLRVEIKLPGITDPSKEKFQTKSLDCNLDTYVISQKGELYREDFEYDENMLVIPNSYKRDYLTEFNGEVTFYTVRSDVYIGKFNKGRLRTLKVTQW